MNFWQTFFGESKGQVCTFACTSIIDFRAFRLPGTRPSRLPGRGPTAWTPPALPGTQMRHYPPQPDIAGPHSYAASHDVSVAEDLSLDQGDAPEGSSGRHRCRHRWPYHIVIPAGSPAGLHEGRELLLRPVSVHAADPPALQRRLIG